MSFAHTICRAVGAACLALILCCAARADAGAALFVGIPEGVPTFRLTTDTGVTLPVALWSSNDWWTGALEELPAGRAGVQYVVDTPWDTSVQPDRVRREYELTPETAPMRRKRLEDGWVAAGYTFVATAAGQVPVRKVDIDLAQKAATESAKVAKLSAPENLRIVADGTPAATTAPGTAAKSFMNGYFGHAIVIVVVLLLGAVIVKVLLLGSNDETWERVG